MQVIYTHVGSILVAVNPFEKLDIYSLAEVTITIYIHTYIHTYRHLYVVLVCCVDEESPCELQQ